ncbi:Diaminopimelate decarboxylase, partial [hydrothermal vent metagenome]
MENQILVSLVKKYGSPLYVYDAKKITTQYNRITKAFSTVKNLKLNYAVKANSNINILKLFRKLNSGIDTVSIQEVQLGIKAGFSPKNI